MTYSVLYFSTLLKDGEARSSMSESMEELMNIYLFETNALKRMYLKYLLKQYLSSYRQTKIRIYATATLSRLRANIGLAAPSNIYFLSVDLSKDHELQILKDIRYKDPLGHIVLFTLNTNLLEKLFTHKLCVLDYLDQHSSKEEYKGTIKETVDFILNNQCSRTLHHRL